MTERTLVLIKPDGVQRLLVGRILARYEERGLKLIGLKLVQVDRDLAERHYAVHRDKPFFAGLVDFITSGPLVALALEGPNAIAVCGPPTARPGRGKPRRARSGATLALEVAQNIVHASDGPETAADRARPVVPARRAAVVRARDRSLGRRAGRLARLTRRVRSRGCAGIGLASGPAARAASGPPSPPAATTTLITTRTRTSPVAIGARLASQPLRIVSATRSGLAPARPAARSARPRPAG